MVTKSTKPTQGHATNLKQKPGDFPLGSLWSRAAARTLARAKQHDKEIVLITNYSWEAGHTPELTNSFSHEEGKIWEVWSVPQVD